MDIFTIDNLNLLFQAIGYLVCIATILVRVSPYKSYHKYIDPFAKNYFRLMAWLPTFGINPQTKELQKAYEKLKDESDKNS